MANEKNFVDLSGTNYDPLETELTQFLGLKVFLVRGWSGADAFHQAQATLQFAHGEAWEQARKDYLAAKEVMLESLRENIAARDPALGAALTADDLFSIHQTGHVTLRAGNTAQEQAVIVFDPVSTPARPVAMIAVSNDKGEKTASFNLAAGSSPPAGTPAQDAAIAHVLKPSFENRWYSVGKREEYPKVKDVIENFDMDIDDIRRYEALMKIRYALRNQNEFLIEKNEYDSDAPTFYLFAGLSRWNGGMRKQYYDLPYREVFEKLSVEDLFDGDRMGFKDKDFLEKLKLANAIMNIVYGNLTPNNTFARLQHRYTVDDKQIKDIMEDLKQRMEDKVQETYGENGAWWTLKDWRILFPVFREVYEADKSEGAQREYLDTIMQGLQKWFPTLTNAPIPAPDRAHEPPRTLAEARAQAQGAPAPAQQAGPKAP